MNPSFISEALGGLIFSFVISSLMVPLILYIASKKGAYDNPDSAESQSKENIGRKQHDAPIPRLGGLGFYLSFGITYFFFAPRSQLDLVFLTSSAAFLIGFCDDLKGLSAFFRLIGQLIVAYFTIQFLEINIQSLQLIPNFSVPLLSFWSDVFCVFVLVGSINAFNMIDGLDGLAAICGIVAILGLTILNSSLTGDISLFCYVSAPILGALFGFLRSNIHPADIFMGDGGSNWIGFVVGILFLAYLSAPIGINTASVSNLNNFMEASQVRPNLMLALLCVAVPVVDAASVIISRSVRKQNPMKADRRHVHYKLLNIGLSHSTVVSFLGVLSTIFAVIATAASFLASNSSMLNIAVFLFISLFIVVFIMANINMEFSFNSSSSTLFPMKGHKFYLGEWINSNAPKIGWVLIMLADVMAISIGLYMGFLLRLDFYISREIQSIALKLLPLAIVSYVLVSLAVRQYQQLFRFATLGTVLQLFRTHFLALVLFCSLIYFSGLAHTVPKSVVLMQFIISFILASVVRFIPRMVRASSYLLPERSKPKCIVYGAGAAGESLARFVRNDPNYPLSILGFVDDDLKKVGKFLHGYRILGRGSDLQELCEKFKVDRVLIAMHSIDGKTLRKVVGFCQHSLATPLMVPDLRKSLDPKYNAPRPVNVKDLLQRTPKATNKDLISGQLDGQVVLITGAGGSIGSEVCRQLLEMRPKKILMVDSSEFNLYSIHTELLDLNISSDTIVPLLGSVTDFRFIDSIFKNHRPSHVFHAAAYKHVHLVEMNPSEAIINNVYGTRVLATAAQKYKVKRFLLISTDKAVRPTSIMGASKRSCELMMQCFQASRENTTCFSAVRFGNVLGSSGSVVPRFMEQIKNGGPVTVTHPEVTRYFMLISEAVALVLQSIVMAKGGEIFVLNMGEPIKIYDMACQLIRLAGKEPGRDIEIVFSGLKTGEKLFEELLVEGREARTDHDDVFELNGGLNDAQNVLAKIDGMISCAKENRDVEAQHILWSLAKHGNEQYTPTLTQEIDTNAIVN